MTRESRVDRLCSDTLDCLPAGLRVRDLRPFYRVATGDEGFHGIFAVLPRRVQQIGRQRLVRLLGHILRRPRPEIVLGDRRNVAQWLSMAFCLIDGPLGDYGPGGAA